MQSMMSGITLLYLACPQLWLCTHQMKLQTSWQVPQLLLSGLFPSPGSYIASGGSELVWYSFPSVIVIA